MPSLDKPKTMPALYSGSKFQGYQKTGRASYNVQIHIQQVDIQNDFICGYLKIKGLTEVWPHLCTFFEGEIIGKKHKFLTRKWEADMAIDLQHWQKFDSFASLKGAFEDDFVYDFENEDFVYMRWKEHFLVPDHSIRSIHGASFAGFYYMCFQKSTSKLNGIYFHRNSEWFQRLSLEHLDERSFADFAFR